MEIRPSETLYSVVLLYSTNWAIKAEKVLAEVGISCKLVPVPRHLSSDCGVCVRIERADQEAALQALQAACVEVEGVHEV
jgi:hypothetical protein